MSSIIITAMWATAKNTSY